ncbi:hypothetical protein FEM48_ZijujUnG0025200 [Ziziphus jujuba var. spinosa]|uniref:Uncharacterized protein n=1 Tax=Ziziphus jujuba var. spinosa TaxID=714518 RepID=A0A978U9R4_ZIZJJ|nr:hypothetical protein FEM48_ZijujUnG0025200 [Ziziphus jujuba var. spinosa]
MKYVCGHADAAIAYGSLLLQGWHVSGVEIPERNSLAKEARKDAESFVIDPVEMAKRTVPYCSVSRM